MEQHHQLKLSHHTTPTPTPPPLSHLPPQPHTNNNTGHYQADDKKNGVDQLQSPESLNAVSPPGVRYRECLKNHAASMGTNVVDGCGEFMPSGKEGTLEAHKCAACQCHRNFHRRELQGFARSVILHIPPHHQIVQPMRVAYGGATESSSDDEMAEREVERPAGSNRKRFRTKFTKEQKEKMVEFAEKLGWRLQRQDDEMVERFCNEIGVRRQVLKVWMHNNKNSLRKPAHLPDHDEVPPPPQHPQIHQ